MLGEESQGIEIAARRILIHGDEPFAPAVFQGPDGRIVRADDDLAGKIRSGLGFHGSGEGSGAELLQRNIDEGVGEGDVDFPALDHADMLGESAGKNLADFKPRGPAQILHQAAVALEGYGVGILFAA